MQPNFEVSDYRNKESVQLCAHQKVWKILNGSSNLLKILLVTILTWPRGWVRVLPEVVTVSYGSPAGCQGRGAHGGPGLPHGDVGGVRCYRTDFVGPTWQPHGHLCSPRLYHLGYFAYFGFRRPHWQQRLQGRRDRGCRQLRLAMARLDPRNKKKIVSCLFKDAKPC